MKKLHQLVIGLWMLGIGTVGSGLHWTMLESKMYGETETVIIQGWLKMNAVQFKIAEILLERPIPKGNSSINSEKGTMKLIRAEKSLQIQIITHDRSEGYYWYHFWQKFANWYGQGEKIGITFVSQAYKDITPVAMWEIIKQIQPSNVITEEENNKYYMAAGYDSFLGEGLTVAGEKLNWNVVYNKDRKRIYFGSPIIYQTY